MRYLFFFILLLGFKNTFSQNLNGEIVDQLSGEPIGLVLVSTEKSKITTDENGTFSISVLPGGDYEQLIKSIKNKLWPLGEDIAFIPGHGPASNFRIERATNPFVSDNNL